MVQIDEFITNQERKLADVLKQFLAGCKCIDICVAFVKRSGVKQLKEALNPEAELRLITGTDFSITEPDALTELSEMPKCEIRLYPAGAVFHPKFYILRVERITKVVLGYSNLAGEAWNTN